MTSSSPAYPVPVLAMGHSSKPFEGRAWQAGALQHEAANYKQHLAYNAWPF